DSETLDGAALAGPGRGQTSRLAGQREAIGDVHDVAGGEVKVERCSLEYRDAALAEAVFALEYVHVADVVGRRVKRQQRAPAGVAAHVKLNFGLDARVDGRDARVGGENLPGNLLDGEEGIGTGI